MSEASAPPGDADAGAGDGPKATGEVAGLRLCTKGCGHPVALGVDRRGQPFRTCCKGCALGKPHSVGCPGASPCDSRASGAAQAPSDKVVVTVDPMLLPVGPDASAHPPRRLCRMNCGKPVRPGRNMSGKRYDTCCRPCARGDGCHSPDCGHPRTFRRRVKRVVELITLWDPIWGQVELKSLKAKERPSLKRRIAVAGWGCCPCLVISCGCFKGEVFSGLTQADIRRAWRRMLCSWSMILACVQVLVLLAPLVLGEGYARIEHNFMIGPYTYDLDRMGAKNTAKILLNNEWWRLLTPMLLHAGWVHLISNVCLQLRTGLVLEVLWGSCSWIFIYVMSGIYATLLSCVFSPNSLSVGSSGALCGLMGAWAPFLVITWNQTLPRDIKVRNAQLILVIISDLMLIPLSFLPMVDFAAHLGGLVAGVFLAMAVFADRLQTLVWRIGTRAVGLGFLCSLYGFTIWYLLDKVEVRKALLYICPPGQGWNGQVCMDLPS